MTRAEGRSEKEAVREPEEEDEPGALIAFVRLLSGLKQNMLARRARMDQSRISRYESGESMPEPATMARILAAGGLRPPLIAPIKSFLRLTRRALASGDLMEPDLRITDRPAEAVQRAVWGVVERSLALARVELRILWSLPVDEKPAPPTAADRSRAEDLLARLKRCRARRRQILVRESRAFHSWLLCVRLCDESLAAAANDAQEALEWASLACEVARSVPGSDAWRSRLRGFAEAFLANAFRVANCYSAAKQAFARGRRLWKEGRDDSGLLDPGRPIDLEAALCRDQGQFGEAIKLHDLARELAWPEQKGVFLLSKANTLEVKGDHETSIELLKEAAREVDRQRQPRLFCVLRFNLAGNLLRLGRAQEAIPIIVEVRTLVDQLQNDLDLVRTWWLEGNALAGLGRHDESIPALEGVCLAFDQRKLPFDYALASLDLALVYRATGRLADVQKLAAEMVKIFQALKVHREAIAAALIFQDAAVRGAVTETLVRRLQDYLPKVKANPKLRFEP